MMLKPAHFVYRMTLGTLALALLAQQNGLAMGGCGGGGGGGGGGGAAGGGAAAAQVLTGFTTVSNAQVSGPSSPADFAKFFQSNPNPLADPLVTGGSVAIDTNAMATGGSWTVTNALTGKSVSLNCGAPQSASSPGPVSSVPSVPQPITRANMVKTWAMGGKKGGGGGGGGGGCGAPPASGGNAPAAQPSAAAVSVILNLSGGFIAQKFTTAPDPNGPKNLNGKAVSSFLTTIQTQLDPTRSQIEILKTSFAQNVIDPGTSPCQLTNAGPDPTVQQLLGRIVQVESAVSSTRTPVTTIVGNLPKGKMLMYAQLQVFGVNENPSSFQPLNQYTLENGNLH